MIKKPFGTHKGRFKFGGLDSADYGVYLQGGGTYDAPERRHKQYIIPGRSLPLTLDEGVYGTVEHRYKAFIARGFEDRIERFRDDLMRVTGYVRLEDDYHKDEYYRAKYMRGLEVDVAPMARAGSFDLVFERDGRRFLIDGSYPVRVTGRSFLKNPTEHPAAPLITVYEYGTFQIGEIEITVSRTSASTGVTVIDSEMMDCYDKATGANLNSAVTFESNDFPTLPGQALTDVQLISGGITMVEIIPNWWRV